MELKTLKGVEIFSAGKWNGDDYTESDLDEMVRAYAENQTARPSIKLGHDKNQKLLQKDGMPSGGIVSALYRVGAKLKADFADVPAKLATLIERKAYRKVSSEVFWNINFNGKTYPRMLSAVSLLGGDMPAVNCLDDVLALYGVTSADRVGVYAAPEGEHTLRQYQLDVERQEIDPMAKTEAEIKLEAERDLERQKSEKATAELATKDGELAELRKFKAESEKRIADAENSAREAKLDASVIELEKTYSLSPAIKSLVKDLLGPEKKEYSLDVKGEKKGDRAAALGEVLKLHAEALKLNTTEQTRAGEESDKNKGDPNEDALDAKIRKYSADNKVSYDEAYRMVLRTEQAK